MKAHKTNVDTVEDIEREIRELPLKLDLPEGQWPYYRFGSPDIELILITRIVDEITRLCDEDESINKVKQLEIYLTDYLVFDPLWKKLDDFTLKQKFGDALLRLTEIAQTNIIAQKIVRQMWNILTFGFVRLPYGDLDKQSREAYELFARCAVDLLREHKTAFSAELFFEISHHLSSPFFSRLVHDEATRDLVGQPHHNTPYRTERIIEELNKNRDGKETH